MATQTHAEACRADAAAREVSPTASADLAARHLAAIERLERVAERCESLLEQILRAMIMTQPD